MEALEKELALKIDELDLKMKDELNAIKDKYNILKKDLRKEYSKKIKDSMPQKESLSRKSIPKIIRNQVWDTYIGKDKGIGKCYCCSKEIDSKHFECGHIKSFATGGTDTVDNLRAICSLCNKSIGSQNMDEFNEKYFNVNQVDKVESSIQKLEVIQKPKYFELTKDFSKKYGHFYFEKN
jgi:hypothetical protein